MSTLGWRLPVASRQARAGVPAPTPRRGAVGALVLGAVAVVGLGYAAGAARPQTAGLIAGAIVGGTALYFLVKWTRLPWPEALTLLWAATLMLGGRAAAYLGGGPIYPTEVLFGGAIVALGFQLIIGARRRDAATFYFPLIQRLGLGLFVCGLLFAFTRGIVHYGTGALLDAGLGYPGLLAAFVAIVYAGRREQQDRALRVMTIASVFVVIPLGLRHFGGIAGAGPQELAVGFVLLFSVAPALDRWLQGRATGWMKLWVVAAPIYVLLVSVSRSTIVGLILGSLLLVAFGMRRRRARFAVAAAALVAGTALLVVYDVSAPTLSQSKFGQYASDTFSLNNTNKGVNAEFRLVLSGILLRRSVSNPRTFVYGVGLGHPLRIEWHGTRYDWRDQPGRGANVSITGPHDGFVESIYRMGWPAGGALVLTVLSVLLGGLKLASRSEGVDGESLRVLVAVVACGVVVILTSDGMRGPQFDVPFAYALGLLAARSATIRMENSQSRLGRWRATVRAPMQPSPKARLEAQRQPVPAGQRPTERHHMLGGEQSTERQRVPAAARFTNGQPEGADGAPALATDSVEYWSAHQPGFAFSSSRRGSPEFFAEVEEHRYALEPHIPEVIGFERWRDRDVLEVGCGIATDGIQLTRAGARYVGVDQSEDALALARHRFALEGATASFMRSQADQLPFDDSSFDMVYSHGVIHHIPDTERVVAEIHRVLRPGGVALVMVYHRRSFNYHVNIMLLRRALARLVLVPGAIRAIARLTGENPAVLEGHRALLRTHGKRYLRDRQLFLNNNTDGPGNPLSTVYSRGEARELFAEYDRVRMQVRHLNLRIIPGGDRISASRMGRGLERWIGWHLYIEAQKPAD